MKDGKFSARWIQNKEEMLICHKETIWIPNKIRAHDLLDSGTWVGYGFESCRLLRF